MHAQLSHEAERPVGVALPCARATHPQALPGLALELGGCSLEDVPKPVSQVMVMASKSMASVLPEPWHKSLQGRHSCRQH